MNILIISSSFPTKSATHQNIFVGTQAKCLADRGHNIWAVATHSETRKEGNLTVVNRDDSFFKLIFMGFRMFLKKPGMFFFLSKNLGIKRTLGLFSLCGACMNIIRKNKIDIIDGHWIESGGIVAYMLSQILKRKYIVTEHGILAELCDGAVGKKSDKESVVIKRVLDNADKIITESKNLMEFIGLYTDKKPILIRYGIDLSKFSPGKKSIFERPTFLSVGSLNKRKNRIELLKAFKILLDKNFDADLVIIGSGSEKDKLKKFIEENNLSRNIKLIDYVENDKLPSYYSSAVAFVLTSLHEGFGLVFIEAEACGCPSIAYNLYAIPEAIGDAGILVKARDIEGVAESMKKILTDKKLRDKLSKNAVNYSKEFSLNKRINEIEKQYKLVLN
ncbi:MAG: glycosyltransferase [Candidatus Aenigmarchaeota archaeon]|nr:glycosyltransferase [Candidatus Aenigmarchaeota archaeon]